MFDDETGSPEGMPGWFAPYFSHEPVIASQPSDYVDPQARLTNTTIYNWIHPIGEVVTSLIESGMTLDWLHEHDAVAWRMFRILVKDVSGLYRWPGKPWLPLRLLARRHQALTGCAALQEANCSLSTRSSRL